tara:strand:- start:499 stop:672 length:174 start_codon:yes stop_codon:yes gene_type:complete
MRPREVKSVLVIGSGPSALVAVKTLKEAGYGVEAITDDTQVGGTFRYFKMAKLTTFG